MIGTVWYITTEPRHLCSLLFGSDRHCVVYDHPGRLWYNKRWYDCTSSVGINHNIYIHMNVVCVGYAVRCIIASHLYVWAITSIYYNHMKVVWIKHLQKSYAMLSLSLSDRHSVAYNCTSPVCINHRVFTFIWMLFVLKNMHYAQWDE